ncbi:MAG: DUF357 domain-containing protein [Nanoarchaeota archaeon]
MPKENPEMNTNSTKEELKKETLKWLKKLEKETRGIKSTGRLDEQHIKSVIKNMNAYMQDCYYFMDKDDWIRAFEAVIYAWGIYESCAHLKLVK